MYSKNKWGILTTVVEVCTFYLTITYCRAAIELSVNTHSLQELNAHTQCTIDIKLLFDIIIPRVDKSKSVELP